MIFNSALRYLLFLISLALLGSLVSVSVKLPKKKLKYESSLAVFFDTEEYSSVAYYNFLKVLDLLHIDVIRVKNSQEFDISKLVNKNIKYVFVNFSPNFLRGDCSLKDAFLEQVQRCCYMLNNKYAKIVIFLPTIDSFEDSKLSLLSLIEKNFLVKLSLKQLQNFLSQKFFSYAGAATSLLPEQPKFKRYKPACVLKMFSTIGIEVSFVKNELLYFNGIMENMKFYPVQSLLQNDTTSFVLDEIARLLGTGKAINYVVKNDSRSLNSSAKRNFAWMDLPLKKDRNKLIALAEACSNVKLAGLWITPAINNIFSDIGVQVSQQEVFITQLSEFLYHIKKYYGQRKLTLPKVYFSVEIANNLVGQHLPKDSDIDMFGNVFFDQPNPLDRSFWNSEVITPFAATIQNLSKTLAGFSVGIVLDMEMYLRKTGSSFSSVSGFSPENTKIFCDKKKIKRFNKKHYGLFYKFLEREAYRLGLWLAKELKMLYKEVFLGFYIPCFPPTWFYIGMFRGFSQNQRLDFFSFYSNFESWGSWFKDNQIFVRNYEVFMLSKLNQMNWQILLTEQLSRSDGIWINRFSRIVDEHVPNSWFDLEQVKQSLHKDLFIKHLQST